MPYIEPIIAEHAEEASFVWFQRAHAVQAPNYSPKQLFQLDERLEAHIDGLRVAIAHGWTFDQAVLDQLNAADFFVAAVLALEARDDQCEGLVDRAARAPEVVAGIVSALGWVSASCLGGAVKRLLDDPLPLRQKLGIAACALHRRDPGSVLDSFLDSDAGSVRARALRTVGELGRMDLLARCQSALHESKPEIAYWGAFSAVLLGDRATALTALQDFSMKKGPQRLAALRMALQAADLDEAHEFLVALSGTPESSRIRIIGAGMSGNPRYVPWLIEQMEHPAHARIAGEAFVNITGADFNHEQLESMPHDAFEDGPNDDPDDEDTTVPEDIALSWPDVGKIQDWWKAHRSAFEAGHRYFLGNPVTIEHCTAVLTQGFQRQRNAAAIHVALLRPGSVLFDCSAPAWRQRRLLASE